MPIILIKDYCILFNKDGYKQFLKHLFLMLTKWNIVFICPISVCTKQLMTAWMAYQLMPSQCFLLLSVMGSIPNWDNSLCNSQIVVLLCVFCVCFTSVS